MRRDLALCAQAIGDVTGADQHDHDRIFAAMLTQRLQRIPAHGRVPGRLCPQHAIDCVIADVERVVFFEEFDVHAPVVVGRRLHFVRNVLRLFRREILEAFLAHRGDDFTGRVDAEHADAVVTRVQENVPVVFPAITPIPVPFGQLDETLLGVEPVDPFVQRGLLRVRKHLEPDQHFAPLPIEFFDQPVLHRVEIEIGMGLADEQQADVGQAIGQFGRGDDLAGRGIGDPVQLE